MEDNKAANTTPVGETKEHSLTRQLKHELGIIKTTIASNDSDSKISAIFAFIASGLWILSAILANFSSSGKGLAVSTLMISLVVLGFVWFSWKKSALTHNEFKHKKLIWRFMFVAFIVVICAIVINITHITVAYKSGTASSGIVVLRALTWVFAIIGVGFVGTSGVLLIVFGRSGHVKNSSEHSANNNERN
ncbi:MAG: hypothetical protein LBJ97_02625 [Mycoplasmataceae bacterium]|nr:hypothetical protein [Mycoplasmataceae bacterium]